MSNKNLISAILVIGILFAAGWIVGKFVQPPVDYVFAQGEQSKRVDTHLLRTRQGLDFRKAESQVQPKISNQQALATANKSIPSTKEAKSVSAELGYLSSPAMVAALQRGEKVDPKYADMGLVWILIFDGIESVSHGPPGAPIAKTSELNVVISATTGEELFSFTYR